MALIARTIFSDAGFGAALGIELRRLPIEIDVGNGEGDGLGRLALEGAVLEGPSRARREACSVALRIVVGAHDAGQRPRRAPSRERRTF